MTTRPLSRLQVAARLLDSLNGLQRVWDARWRQICDEAEVHASQAQALLFLCDRGPMPMRDLASGLCVAPSTGTRLIEQMEKVGWVARSGDPGDRRRVLIHLLGPGEEKAWTLQALAQEALWSHASGLGDAESALSSLERLTGLLSRND